MKRSFSDLHLRANPEDQKNALQLINKAAKLGYRYISIPCSVGTQQTEITALKEMSDELGLNFVTRTDYRPRNEEDLMRFLRKFRRQYEVIGIICDNKDVARKAAKDRRVDLINFPSIDYHNRFFDRAQAELSSCSLAALEVDMKPLLVLEGPPRVRLLSYLRREVAIAIEFGVPIVISSGVSEDQLMRLPRDLASLTYLFGLGEGQALDAVSINAEVIVKRNRAKLDSKFIAPGVSLIKEGKST
jgi:RNase P/RNase MRP subunit p30